MPRFCPILRTFLDFFKNYSFPETVAKVAKHGSLRPSVVVCSSQLVVGLGCADLPGFLNLLTIERANGGVAFFTIGTSSNHKFLYPLIK